MELIQPTRHSQFIDQAPMVKHAPGKRLLLVDPYPRNNPYRLTASERRVAELAAQGLPSREIARTLVISPRTVDAHLNKVFRKLGVSSRAEVAHRL